MNFIFYALLFILFPFMAQSQIKLEKITPELSNLWGVSVLNKEEVLFTQRAGKLFRLNVFKKEMYEVKGAPKVFNYGQGGLLDIAIEEDNNKKIIYLCFSKITKNSESATAINSYEFQNDELFNKKQIFVSNKSSRSSRHFGCRLAINSKYIFATIGDRGTRNDSQNLKNHSGSVIKILKNGNYYNNKAFKNSLPEIFSIGHRNPQGLTFNIDKTNLWLHEHGPQGGDELNLIVKGKNYGWPKITFGKEYGSGRTIGMGTSKPGYEDPLKVWIPSIAPSGIMIYKGTMFEEFKDKVIIGSLKFRQLHLLSLKNNIVVSEEKILTNQIGRIRDLKEMSDGSIIIINDEFNGGVYRLYKQ